MKTYKPKPKKANWLPFIGIVAGLAVTFAFPTFGGACVTVWIFATFVW
jgi:hypothetical protein